MQKWLKENRKLVKVVWFPTARPGLNPLEECRGQTKDARVACRLYLSRPEMKKEPAIYLRTRRFKLDMVKYLSR